MNPKLAEIVAIEEILGNDYGKVPTIIENTWKNRYFGHIKSCKTPTSFVSGLITASLRNSNETAMYDGKTHTIYVPPSGISLNPFSEFAKYHELGHAYTRQRSRRFQAVDDTLATEGSQSWFGGNVTKKTILDAFLLRCVDEGIADYLAIEAQKVQVKSGRDPHSVYCFEREWMLTTFDNPEEGTMFVASTPLSHEMAQTLVEEGNEVLDEFLSVNKSRGLERIKKSIEAVGTFQDYAYLLGHYLVRSVCQNQSPKGGAINYLILNPPQNLQALQDIVLQNM